MRNKTREAFLKKHKAVHRVGFTALHPTRRRGIALVWSAIMLMTLLLFTGISIDFARGYLAAHQLQNAADAAALAGAQIVRCDTVLARNQAVKFGLLNFCFGNGVVLNRNDENIATEEIVVGRYSFATTPRFTPMDISTGRPRPNAIKVVARRTAGSHGPIPLIFGPIAGIFDVNISRYAIAEGSGCLGAGLLVLSEDCTDQPSLKISGGLTVSVNDGAVQVNMPDCGPKGCDAIKADGGPTVIADEIDLVSKCDSTGGYVFDPATDLTVTTGQPPIPDPYANVPAPYPSTYIQDRSDVNDTTVTTGQTRTFEPGYYPEGFQINGGFVTFKPGIYVIGSTQNRKPGLAVTGGEVWAERVMFYINNDNSPEVKIDGTSGGKFIITEMDTVNPGNDHLGNPITYTQDLSYLSIYNGMAIFQGRNNETEASITGGSGMDIEGTIYFPSNNVKLAGTPSSVGIQVIAYTMEISGGAKDILIINYDGRNRTPAGRSYLVE
jgi:hypothetical protein